MQHIETAFEGRVAITPELKVSQGGKPYCKLSVAVGEGDDTQWVRVTCFNAKAQEVAGSIEKGMIVYVEGTLKLSEWQDHQGKQRANLAVSAWRVRPLGLIGHKKPGRKAQDGQIAVESSETPPKANGRQRPSQGDLRDYQRPLELDHSEIPFE